MSEEIRVDARGLACPLPVVKTKDALEKCATGDTVVTLVDNEAARENVSRMARGRGCAITVEGCPPEIRVRSTKAPSTGAALSSRETVRGSKPKVVAYVNKDKMGHGDTELGDILMKAFLQTLKDVDPKPSSVIFVNSGVLLSTRGSKVAPVLSDLEKRGIGIVSCGTCLDYYKLMDKVEVGVVSNMYEIVSLLTGADRILTP